MRERERETGSSPKVASCRGVGGRGGDGEDERRNGGRGKALISWLEAREMEGNGGGGLLRTSAKQQGSLSRTELWSCALCCAVLCQRG